MEELNRKRKEQLSFTVSIIFIVSGIFFDASDIILKTSFDTWTNTHLFLKDLQSVGFSILAFMLCPYSKLKIKAFTFMLIIWRVLVLTLNPFLTVDSLTHTIIPVYAIYLIWLYRVLTIDDREPVNHHAPLMPYIDKETRTFNILLPINTFRGLLQSLFTFANPKYETRILSHMGKLYSVQKSKFVQQDYDDKTVEDLVNKAGAKIKLVGVQDKKKIEKVKGNLGKRCIIGIRDCRRLEL